MSARCGLSLAFGGLLLLGACGRSGLEGLLELAGTAGPSDAGGGGGAGAGGRPLGGAGGPPIGPPPAGAPDDVPPPPFDAGAPPEAPLGDCAPLPTRASEWPMVGHDARATNNDGAPVRELAALDGVETRWNIVLGYENASDPLIAGGRIFLPRVTTTSALPSVAPEVELDWQVHDLATARLLCELNLHLPLPPGAQEDAEPVIHDGVLYTRVDDVTGLSSLGAFDADTGRERWQLADFARATWPVVTGDTLVASGGGISGLEVTTPRTAAVSLADASLSWVAVGAPPNGVQCPAQRVSVAADTGWGRVFVRSDCARDDLRRTLHAHDLATGAERWSYRDTVGTWEGFAPDTPFGATALLLGTHVAPGPLLFEGAGGRRLVGITTAEHDLVAFDADTGEVVWQTPAHADGALRNTFGHRALAGGRIVIAANGATLSDPDLPDGRTTCPGDGPSCSAGDPVGAKLIGVRPGTGEVAWTRELPALVTTTLAATGSWVLFGMVDDLVVVDATDGSELARLPLRQLLHPTPRPEYVARGQLLVAEDRIVLRMGDSNLGMLYGIALPSADDTGADGGVASEDGGT